MKFIQLQLLDFLTKMPQTYIGEWAASSTNSAEKPGYQHAEE